MEKPSAITLIVAKSNHTPTRRALASTLGNRRCRVTSYQQRVLMNPPFIGTSNHNNEQKADRAHLFGSVKVLDYVAC